MKLFTGNIFSMSKATGTFFEIFKNFQVPLYVGLAIGFLGRGVALYAAIITGQWMDQASKGQVYSLESLFLSLVMCLGLGVVLTGIFRVMISRTCTQATHQLHYEVMKRTSLWPMSYFDRNQFGKIVSRFSHDYGNIFRIFGGPVAEFLTLCIDFILIVFFTAHIHILFLPLLILFCFVQAIIFFKMNRMVKKSRQETSHQKSLSLAHFNETAFGTFVIRQYNKQSKFINRFKLFDKNFQAHREKSIHYALSMNNWMSLTTTLFIFIIGLSGMYFLQMGYVSVGDLGATITYSTLIASVITQILEWLNNLEEAFVGMDRLNEFLYQPIEHRAVLPYDLKYSHLKNHFLTARPEPSALALMEHPTLELKHVGLRYHFQNSAALSEIHFNVMPQIRLGIIGRTGSGKSSILSAILGLYPLSSGGIYLNDHEVVSLSDSIDHEKKLISLNYYRRHFSLVSQDHFIFAASLRENLRGPNRGITDERIQQVLVHLGLEAWLAQLPQGLDTLLSPFTSLLSHGQKQLLCIARGLLNQAPIMIFDEISSSLDGHSERRVMQELWKVKSSHLIIAHRLHTLESCDELLWIEAGHVKMFDRTERVLSSYLKKRV